MRVRFFKPLCAGLALTSFLVLSGCASSPDPRLYVLDGSNAQRTQSSLGSDISILVSPVVLPDYMNRPEIVFKSGDNRIIVNQNDRWAGSLKDNVTSVITSNLSAYLNTNESFDYFANFTAKPDVTVRIRVLEFGRVDDLTSVLNVSWELVQTATGQTQLFTEKFTTQIQTSDATKPDLTPDTQAMSQALDQLSLKISEQILSLVKQGRS